MFRTKMRFWQQVNKMILLHRHSVSGLMLWLMIMDFKKLFENRICVSLHSYESPYASCISWMSLCRGISSMSKSEDPEANPVHTLVLDFSVSDKDLLWTLTSQRRNYERIWQHCNSFGRYNTVPWEYIKEMKDTLSVEKDIWTTLQPYSLLLLNTKQTSLQQL